MASLTALLKLVEGREPGPPPGFTMPHLLLAFLSIGESGKIGRQALAKSSGLGEGSIRTVLNRFKKAGYVNADLAGCHLTDSGMELYRGIVKKLSPAVSLPESTLAVGRFQLALAVRASGGSVASGLEQRDSAIRMGASGATTYVIKKGKFTIPGGSKDCERDFPSNAWRTLRTELGPRDGDAVILCGAEDETTAKLGALSAALTLP